MLDVVSKNKHTAMYDPFLNDRKTTPSQIVTGGVDLSPWTRFLGWLGHRRVPVLIGCAVVLVLGGGAVLAFTMLRQDDLAKNDPAVVVENGSNTGSIANGGNRVDTNNAAGDQKDENKPDSDKPQTGQGGAGGGSSGSGSGGGSGGGGTTSCALPKYPTTACTGVPAGTSLQTVSGNVTLSTPGQVLDGKLVTGNVTVSANNVVIKNSEIHGRIRNTSGQSFTIEDSLVGPTSGCLSVEAVGYENYTARRVQMRNVSDGFRVSGDNVRIEDSFILLCSQPGDHSDGIQGYFGGQNIVVNHNTIDQRFATDNTSPIFFADDSQSATITNNLLMGGGYTLRIHDDATPDIGPWVVTGNRIVSGAWDYDPVSTTNTQCSGVTWSDNRLVTIDSNYNVLSTGATVACDD